MNKFRKTSFVMVLLLLFALLVMVGLSTSFAADRNITNTTDGGISGAVNSSLANDKIIMSDGVYSGNNNKDIIINKNLTITGSNKANTVIDLSGGSKLFTINSGVRLILQNLTIKNAIIGNNSYLINNDGYLTIENCVITDNSLSFNIRENTTYTNNDVLENDSFESGYLIGNNGQMNIINSAFINNNMNINYQYYQNVPYTNTTILYFNNTIYNSSVVGSGFIVNKGRLNITRSEFTNNTIKTTVNREYNWNNDQNININLRNPNGELVIGDQSTDYVYAMIVNTGDLIITQSNFQNNINSYNETRNYNKNTTITINGGTGKKTIVASIYNLIYSNSNLEVNNSNFTNNGYNIITYVSNNLNYKNTFTNAGTIYITTLANSTASVDIVNSTFENSTADDSGGAFYITTLANGTVSIDILNSTIVNNTATNAGGGVFVASGDNGIVNMDIANSIFENNKVTGSGGAVYFTGTGNLRADIVNSTFENNTAAYAGGIAITTRPNGNTSVDILNSTFKSNAATGGGAIYVSTGDNGTVSIDIVNSTFENNTATNTAGVFSVSTGVNGTVSIDIVNSTFENNTAAHGTVFSVSTGVNGTVSIGIVNSTFENNTATNTAGAIYVGTGVNGTVSIDIADSTFTGNNASNGGGAVYIRPDGTTNVNVTRSNFINNSAGYGGAISINNYGSGTANLNIIDSTFTSNNAINTIDINSATGGISNVNITGSIFVSNSNTNGVIFVNSPTPNVKVNYNVFFNQTTPITSSSVNNNVNADYNYYGYNSIPSTMSNIVVNSYYVLGITNMSDLSGNYSVGDLLEFNYTVYLNGSSDSTGSDLLPSMNGVYWNGTFFKEFGLSNSGVIEVPIQTIANPDIVFKNSNGTIIGSFTLTGGSISKGNITNITVDQLTIVNNTVADVVLHINPNIGGLSPITFEVTIDGQSRNVTFVNGTGVFTGFNYGQLGNQNLSISFASTDDYNATSTNLNTSFKDNVNLDVTANDVTYGDNITIVINATTPNGTAILDGIYEVIINNITYNVTFVNGIGRVNITGLDANEYTYTILFKENNYYTESDDNVNFIVSKSGTIVNVELPSDAVYGENSTIAGNITDANGNLINGTYNITVTINGVEYNVTVIDGLWSLTIPNTKSGLSNIDISFFGDNNYNNATIATNYTVNS
ncbi:beta strand repeat-containing protein, partial [Methanobrevibacter cuticularis]|uniref:beta strand repeat-containing protein n=1 Tax=Methanobrevibacter cuticularis TaxID=47311 RepID=UPI000AFE15B7